jgi:hypothetical protein
MGTNRDRFIKGIFPSDSPVNEATAHSLTLMTDFVVSKGGAYFFVPSLTALKGVLTTSPP